MAPQRRQSDIKSRPILSALSFGMLLISLVNLIPTESLNLWRLSVLTTEFGHFFALFNIILIFVLWASVFDYLLLAINLIAIGIFLSPLFFALRSENQIKKIAALTLQKPPSLQELIHLPQVISKIEPKRISFQRFVYFSANAAGERNLNLDLYRNSQRPHASPWVLIIHGGGWESGNTEQLPELNWYLAAHGYSVVSATYRFAPDYKWPSQKEDILKALSYVREKSDEFGLDMNNFFILGRSAGAQIAGVVAYQMKDPGLRGFISFYSPTDLTFGYEIGSEVDIINSRSLLRGFLGGTPFENPEIYKDASVIEAMLQNPNPVPSLIFHGQLDRLSFYKHSERLADRLRFRKIPYAYVEMPWATHGFDYSLAGPSGQISTHIIEYFLNSFVRP
jgi:acetyl esterase/lipase